MKPKGEKDPLAQVEKACQVIKLSTCMRTIYVLNKDALSSEEQQRAYQALIAFIQRKDIYSASTQFEYLEGPKAYQFLLYWIIGGVNPKQTFHDVRILGDVRAIWTKMCASPSYRVQALVEQYKFFFKDLFSDSIQLSKLISIYESLEQKSLAIKLQAACLNCSWARTNGLLGCLVSFNYVHFAEGVHPKELEKSLSGVQEKLSIRSKAPSGEEALQTLAAEHQREGIRKRLLEIEQLLLFLNSLKPKPLLEEGAACSVQVEGEVVLKSKESEQSLVSTRIVVKPSGLLSFFIQLGFQQKLEQAQFGHHSLFLS